MKETLFIINPASARGRTLRSWNEKRRLLFGHQFEEHLTSRAGEAAEITREALRRGVSRVIAVGGDGTLGEIINGYFDSGQAINPDAWVGLIASGTGSDFQRSLPTRAPDIGSLLKSEGARIDAAQVTFTTRDGQRSRAMINLVSLGLGGETVAMVNRWRDSLPRWISGQARYATAALLALARYENTPVEVTLDEERIQIESFLIAIANGRYAGGGMMFAPHAELDDGLLDVILTDRASRLDIIRELARIRRGEHLKNPKVMERRARQVSIASKSPLAVDIDGEMVGHTPAQVRILHKAVRFLAG
ncbi:MAG: diacylglycerol kinase family protein [Acidobacteriota bacterium]